MQLRRAGAYVCGEITVGPATASASQVGWALPTRHRWRSKWPVGDGHATSFAMAVAKGEWGVRRRKRFRRRGLRTRKGAMVLRAIGAGKRQNLGGFATRGRAADGKTAGCGGGVLQNREGFATKVRENTCFRCKTPGLQNGKPCGRRELSTTRGTSFGNPPPACCKTRSSGDRHVRIRSEMIVVVRIGQAMGTTACDDVAETITF